MAPPPPTPRFRQHFPDLSLSSFAATLLEKIEWLIQKTPPEEYLRTRVQVQLLPHNDDPASMTPIWGDVIGVDALVFTDSDIGTSRVLSIVAVPQQPLSSILPTPATTTHPPKEN